MENHSDGFSRWRDRAASRAVSVFLMVTFTLSAPPIPAVLAAPFRVADDASTLREKSTVEKDPQVLAGLEEALGVKNLDPQNLLKVAAAAEMATPATQFAPGLAPRVAGLAGVGQGGLEEAVRAERMPIGEYRQTVGEISVVLQPVYSEARLFAIQLRVGSMPYTYRPEKWNRAVQDYLGIVQWLRDHPTASAVDRVFAARDIMASPAAETGLEEVPFPADSHRFKFLVIAWLRSQGFSETASWLVQMDGVIADGENADPQELVRRYNQERGWPERATFEELVDQVRTWAPAMQPGDVTATVDFAVGYGQGRYAGVADQITAWLDTIREGAPALAPSAGPIIAESDAEVVSTTAGLEETQATLKRLADAWGTANLPVLRVAAVTPNILATYSGLQGLVGRPVAVGNLHLVIVPETDEGIAQLIGAYKDQMAIIYPYGPAVGDTALDRLEAQARQRGVALLYRQPLEGATLQAILFEIIANLAGLEESAITDADLDTLAKILFTLA